MRGRVIAVVVLGAWLLAGCGGEEVDPEEKKARAALTEALTTADPLACTTLMTTAYVQQYTTEKTTPEARRACRGNIGDDRAQSVDIARVAVRGGRAEAVFSTNGGSLPFSKATIDLRRVDGAWQLHRVTDATLDRRAFFTSIGRELRTGADRLPGPIVDCTLRALKDVSDRRIVNGLLAPNLSFFLTPTALCALRITLVDEGVSKRRARCITQRVSRALRGRDGEALRDELRSNGESSPRFNRLVTRNARRCA